MTVEANTVQYVYTGNGVTTAFSFPSKFSSNFDIIVGLDGVQQVGGYVVNGEGLDAGGTVTFTTAPANGVIVMLVRNPSQSQLTNYVNAVTVLAPTLTNALDKLTMIAQWMSRQFTRSIRMSDLDIGVLSPLPSAAARAGKLLGFGPSGDIVTPVDTDDVQNAIAISDDIAAALTANQSLLMRQFPGTGPIPRTYYSAAQDWVNVKEFGITGSGDETAKLQSAINWLNSNGKFSLVFENVITISAPISIPNADIEIVGVGGRRKPLINQVTAGANVLNVTGSRVGLKNFTTYMQNAASGAIGVNWEGDDGYTEDLSILNSWNGLRAVSHNLQSTRLNILTFRGYGMLCQGTVGGWHKHFRIVAGTAGDNTYGVNGGIRWVNQVESVNFSDGEVLAGRYSFTSDATSPVLSNRPTTSRLMDVFLDGSTNGCDAEDLYLVQFIGCWVSGGREGDTHGFQLRSGRGVDFIGTDFVNCGRNGLDVQSGATDVNVIGGRAYDNAKSSTDYFGVNFGVGCTDFSVIGVRTGNGIVPAYGPWPNGRQTYGVGVQAGCNRFRVRDCGNNGNLTASVYMGTAASATAVYADNF